MLHKSNLQNSQLSFCYGQITTRLKGFSFSGAHLSCLPKSAPGEQFLFQKPKLQRILPSFNLDTVTDHLKAASLTLKKLLSKPDQPFSELHPSGDNRQYSETMLVSLKKVPSVAILLELSAGGGM